MRLRLYKKDQYKVIEFKDEIEIETDGEGVYVTDGEAEFYDYGSPLEMLYVVSWFMRAAKKTTLILDESKTEFVRKRDYKLGELIIHGKHKNKDKTDKNS